MAAGRLRLKTFGQRALTNSRAMKNKTTSSAATSPPTKIQPSTGAMAFSPLPIVSRIASSQCGRWVTGGCAALPKLNCRLGSRIRALCAALSASRDGGGPANTALSAANATLPLEVSTPEAHL